MNQLAKLRKEFPQLKFWMEWQQSNPDCDFKSRFYYCEHRNGEITEHPDFADLLISLENRDQ